MKWFALIVFSASILFVSASSSIGEEGKMVIENGRVVEFDYTLTVDGEIVDSSKGRQPLKYNHGKGEIIPGLARQMEGMRAGDEKMIVVAPEEAYGIVDRNAFREIERSTLPANIKPEVGMILQMKAADGRAFPVRIAELKEKTVLADFNHPLAGKTLNFQVKVVSIQ